MRGGREGRREGGRGLCASVSMRRTLSGVDSVPVQGGEEAMSRVCFGAVEGREARERAEAWVDVKEAEEMREWRADLRSVERALSVAI